jgi:ribosomal protein L9
MDNTILAVKHEFLKRDLIQVSAGYIIACIGLVGFAAKAAKLESKLNLAESKNEELENSNKELLKSMKELHVELARTQLQTNS